MKYHATKNDLLVVFYKKNSGRPSMNWPESVDQALCFGWIDSVRRSRDDTSYTILFSPRKPRSIWSSVNIKRAQVMIAEGKMQPAGLEAFGERREKKSEIYSYEQGRVILEEPYAGLLKSNKTAHQFF